MSRITYSLCVVISLICLGCAVNRQKQPPAPTLSASVTHYAGRVLAPAATQPSISAASASPVTLELFALPAMPKDVLKSFGASSQLVTGVGTENALLAVPESMAKARLGSGAEATWVRHEAIAGSFGKPESLGTFNGVLAPDISVRCAFTTLTGSKPDLELILHEPAALPASLQVGLVARYTPSAATTQPVAGEEGGERLETSIAAVPLTSTQSDVAVLVPYGSGSVLAFITVGERGGRIPEASLRQARADLAEASHRSAALSAEQMMVQSALSAMQSPETRRSALAQLAGQTGATLCQDLVLSADDKALEDFAPQATKALAGAKPGGTGWALDRAAFDYLGQLKIAGKLPPELDTVLTIHAGEAGHSTVSLEQLVGKIATRKDLDNRLIAENYVYLEEVSPSARVRAFDWLKARGKAPANYDPMGPPQQRRKALDAAIEAMSTTAPTTQPVAAGGRP